MDLTHTRAFWHSWKAHAKKNILIYTRYKGNMLIVFLQVFLIFSMFSFAIRAFIPETGSTGFYDLTTFNALMALSLGLFLYLSGFLWEIGYGPRNEQYQGTIEMLFMTPTPSLSVLLGYVVPEFILDTIYLIFILASFHFIFGGIKIVLTVESFFYAIIGLFGSLILFAGFSFIVAGIGIYLRESVNFLINISQISLMVLSAIFFPFSVLPKPILFISKLLPTSYAIDLFRSSLVGFPRGELLSFPFEVLIVVPTGVFFLFVGAWFFTKIVRNAREKGVLGHF